MDLIKELGLEDFSQEDRNEIIVQVTESLLKRLMARAYGSLDATDRKEFEKLATAKDQAGMEKFFSEKVSDIDRIKQEELANLVAEVKEFLGTSK